MTKLITVIILTVFAQTIFPVNSEFAIKGKVKKRNTIIRADNNVSTCYYNGSMFKNIDSLRRVVAQSKYIFTGKISKFQSVENKRGRRTFKVFVRKILKGNVGGLSDVLNFETRTNRSSNRAYILAEGYWKVCGSSRGWAAILFSGGPFVTPLKLLIEPVPITRERVKRVKALIKGNVLRSD